MVLSRQNAELSINIIPFNSNNQFWRLIYYLHFIHNETEGREIQGFIRSTLNNVQILEFCKVHVCGKSKKPQPSHTSFLCLLLIFLFFSSSPWPRYNSIQHMSMCLEKTIVSRKGRVGGGVLRGPMRVLPSGGHPDTIPSL